MQDERFAVRFNETEYLKFQQLQNILNEDDKSKTVKFAIDWALHHINYVTGALVGPDWEVIFQRKRKTQQLKRKVYFD